MNNNKYFLPKIILLFLDELINEQIKYIPEYKNKKLSKYEKYMVLQHIKIFKLNENNLIIIHYWKRKEALFDIKQRVLKKVMSMHLY